MTGEPAGGKSPTSESARRHGLLDAVIAPGEARPVIGRWVALLSPASRAGPLPPGTGAAPPEPARSALPAWELVQRARRADRPRARAYVDALVTDLAEVHGDRAGADDPAVLAGVRRIGQRTVAVLGQAGTALTPGAFRLATRTAALATRMRLSLITLIDTPGADRRRHQRTAASPLRSPRRRRPSPRYPARPSPSSSARAAAAVRSNLGIIDRILPGPTEALPAAAIGATRDAVIAALRELDATPDRLAARRHRYRS